MMKKYLFIFTLMISFSIQAKDLTLMSEAGQMGTFYSLASLCGENQKRLSDYELIASRIMANRSETESEEETVKKEYIWQKLKAFQKYQGQSLPDCYDILKKFRQMPLFQSIVYSDGGIKMYDGTYFPPKRPFQPEND